MGLDKHALSAAAVLGAVTVVAQGQGDVAGLTTLSNTNGGVPWNTAQALAMQLVSQMTPEEQNNITFGTSSLTGGGANGCAGVSGSVPRLNFSGICLTDAGNGVRGTDLVTGFASGVSVAASWNSDLAHQRALYMGAEFKRKGVHVVNGPVVGPIGRIARDGRAWEGFGTDPYLGGALAEVTVAGLQQSVISSVKHYIGNEQETQRNPNPLVPAISSNIGDQALHEVYLWPFQDAVRAGAGSVMCSYNRLNSTYACSDNHTLNYILKGELAFPGFVLSDWGAQHDTFESANGGLDLAMPDSPYWENNTLAGASTNGSLATGRLADMAERIVGAWYHIFNGNAGNIELGVGMPADLLGAHTLVEGRDPASKPSTLQSAIEGHVLLKNTNNALPLDKPKFLSLFGYDATVAPVNNPSSSPLDIYTLGLQSVNVSSAGLVGILTGASSDVPEAATLGTWLGGGGSGAVTTSYWSDPYSAIQAQAYEDDTFLRWDFQSTDPAVSVASDACLVFINEIATEGIDRAGLADPDSDTLVKNVANKCANTIVVIHNVGIRTVDAWFDHPNVTALMFAHLPGQDSGRALVNLLYGKQSPSGRLPYTNAKTPFDYGPLLNPCTVAQGDFDPQCDFTEGVDIDYRYFLVNDITPRFAFGYGLTYSSFTYSNLSVSWTQPDAPTQPPNPTVVAPGGMTSLFDTLATATFSITNTGSVAAAEVPQLYVQFPGEDRVRVLRGFAKKVVQPGETWAVDLALTRRDLSRWDVGGQMWVLQGGEYAVFVGKDVLDPEGLMGSISR